MKKIVAVIMFLLLSGASVFALSNYQALEYRDVEFFDFDLEVELSEDGKKVHAHWDAFPEGEDFKWYKLMYSTTVSNPEYPLHSAIFVGTQRRNQLNHSFYLKDTEVHYVRICTITETDDEPKGRYCSKTQKIVLDDDDDDDDDEKPTMCTMEYAPVCGKRDGEYKIYSNNCMREGADAYKIDMRYCEQKEEPVEIKECTREYRPVCGEKNGEKHTFGNKCMMEAEDAKYLYGGKCENIRDYGLSDDAKEKIRAIVARFIDRLEAKDYSNEKNIQTINLIIDRLETLGKQDKYRAIIAYMIHILKEYREEYEDDFGVFEDIFSDF